MDQWLIDYFDRYKENKYVFKSCKYDWIIVLKKLQGTKTNEDREGIVNIDTAKFRANKLLVVDIVHKHNQSKKTSELSHSYHQHGIVYTNNKIVIPDWYDPCPNNVCTGGIHYFKSYETAFHYDNIASDRKLKHWFDNGQQYQDGRIANDKKVGAWKEWQCNGQKSTTGNYVSGKFHGTWTTWDEHGNKIDEDVYHNNHIVHCHR